VKRRDQSVGNRRFAAARADEAGTAEHCRKHLGGFLVRKFIRNFDEMPMTATGKLRKVELRQALPNTSRKKGR
jgi:long-chain acyl-CoA synthetase